MKLYQVIAIHKPTGSRSRIGFITGDKRLCYVMIAKAKKGFSDNYIYKIEER